MLWITEIYICPRVSACVFILSSWALAQNVLSIFFSRLTTIKELFCFKILHCKCLGLKWEHSQATLPFSTLCKKIKYTFWVSKSVNPVTTQLIQNTLGIRTTTDLGFYLGYPLIPSYKASDFSFIITNINKNPQGWKSNILSKAGRTQLINSTLSSLANHVMKDLLFLKPSWKTLTGKQQTFLGSL